MLGKLQQQVQKNILPQRLLLVGASFDEALGLAAQLLSVSSNQLTNHSDILVIRNNGESIKVGEKDAATNTLRGMTTWAFKTPAEANKRIIVVEDIDRFTHAAANASLKLLEEPPHYLYFICTTQNPHRLIDTIRSRMRMVFIPSEATFMADSEIQKLLESGSLHDQLQFIEGVDKSAKKAKSKEIWKTTMRSFLMHARNVPSIRKCLPRIWEAQKRLQENGNPRFTFEHLLLDLAEEID